MTALTPRHLTLSPALVEVADHLTVWGEGNSPFRVPEDVLSRFFGRLSADRGLFYIYTLKPGEKRLNTLGEAVQAMRAHLDAKEGNTVIVRINGTGHEDFPYYTVEFGLAEGGKTSPRDASFLAAVEISELFNPDFEGKQEP
jgi:hypothetical protein